MNQEFESVNLMKKNKVLDVYHVYYIDTTCGFLYVADRIIKMDRYRKVIANTETYVIIEEDFGDGCPRQFKGFKKKSEAMTRLPEWQRT